MSGPKVRTIYTVWEQWPQYEVVCFYTEAEAREYVVLNRHRMAMPMISSKVVY